MARLLEPGSPGDITLSGKEMIAVFSGRVKAGDGLALDGQLNVQVNQSSTLTSWFSLPAGFMTDTAVLNLASGISSNGLAFDLPTLEAKFGSSVVKGKARLEAGLDRPKVSAELSTDMLSIFPRASQLLAKPWSEAAISTQALNAFDADIKIKADHLQMRGSDFVGGTVETNLANGGLTVNAKLAGPMDFALGLKPVEQSYLLNLKMSAENVDAAGVLNGWFGLSAITGTLTADATFTSNGKSFAELVSTLKGSLSTSLKEGRVDGADLTIFVQSATQGWPPGNTKALTFNQKGIVEEGVLKLSDASLNVAGSSFKPKGEIDFLRQAFDLQLTNKLSLTGPWTKPSTVPPLGPAPALRSPSEEPAAISPPGN